MGDAGLPPPIQPSNLDDAPTSNSLSSTHTAREINALVTGFGAFKAFNTNPSYLITSALPLYIDPKLEQPDLQKINASSLRRPTAQPNDQPYRIKIHAYPNPIRVAYASTATFVPRLIGRNHPSLKNDDYDSSDIVSPAKEEEDEAATEEATQTQYDYVLHIGMAGGRDSYALETTAHRDHYKIKDVDDRDGFMAGEYVWKRENLPESFEVGWHKQEVLARWEKCTESAEDTYEEDQMEKLGYGRTQLKNLQLDDVRDKYRAVSLIGKGRRAVVKLSNEAGRFLCEFILYTSLSTRWKEARQQHSSSDTNNGGFENDTTSNVPSSSTTTTAQPPPNSTFAEKPMDHMGKIAFLHVPGGTSEHDIARGVRVTKAAILALVSSWEDGYRNSDVLNNTTANTTTSQV